MVRAGKSVEWREGQTLCEYLTAVNVAEQVAEDRYLSEGKDDE